MKRRLPFPILYEDRDVIVADKPAGLLTTPTRAGETRTLEGMLSDYLRKGQLRSRLRAWLVHRLDRETSGVILFAKSEAVQQVFRNDWAARTEKTYLARVAGTLDAPVGTLTSYLRDDPKTFRVKSVKRPEDGKFAATDWRRLDSDGKTTLVEVTLRTGRKNQIRAQFSEAGHPVVGDVKYGGPAADRLYLHARRLRFRHPHTEAWIECASEPAVGNWGIPAT